MLRTIHSTLQSLYPSLTVAAKPWHIAGNGPLPAPGALVQPQSSKMTGTPEGPRKAKFNLRQKSIFYTFTILDY
ncbi:hypothetical protein DUI87_04863 [Hirundo rustica rustica]|uniref:Uncharacterized protein n=1 Tax=Hirundo rustica rustica TaxID=333673 RepID=A0A3M0KXL4_HIRRU|nr:hypothetical protein DUI87_04863 [Hirundo rustica rustica]